MLHECFEFEPHLKYLQCTRNMGENGEGDSFPLPPAHPHTPLFSKPYNSRHFSNIEGFFSGFIEKRVFDTKYVMLC